MTRNARFISRLLFFFSNLESMLLGLAKLKNLNNWLSYASAKFLQSYRSLSHNLVEKHKLKSS